MTDTTPERMLVILGTGASHDCLPFVNDDSQVAVSGLGTVRLAEVRPPVTQQLVQPRLLTNWFANRWDWARPLVDRLQRVLGAALNGDESATVVTLEDALTSYQASCGSVPDRQRHLLAFRFFLRDVFALCTDAVHSASLTGGVTNHVALLSAAMDWCGRKPSRSVVFISFNYDIILEQAMAAQWGFDALQLSDYLRHPQVQLLKPHGSIVWNWPLHGARPLTSEDDTDSFGRASIELALSQEIDHSDIKCEKAWEPWYLTGPRPRSFRHSRFPCAPKANFCGRISSSSTSCRFRAQSPSS